MNPLLKISGLELARMIREREVTSEEVVATHIAHVRSVNPVINAVVAERFDAAMDEARAADRTLAKLGPERVPAYHGVPCTIKEAFRLTGMPNTSGLYRRKGIVADSDAITVKRMREAGAIPMGVTNVPELCMWMETHNTIYGRTRNPYNAAHIVGGSSGGEGAIVGSGASPFGLGADIGGSIRMPSFFNGVFGHKCTSGLIPNIGQHPVPRGISNMYLSTGPICRRAEDLWPLVNVMKGPAQGDAWCREMPLGDPATVDWKSVRILDVPDNSGIRVSMDLQVAQKKAVEHFRRLGATIKKMRFHRMKQAFLIWSSMLSASGEDSFASSMGEGQEIPRLWELMKWCVGASDHTIPAIVLAIMEIFPKFAPKRAERFIEEGRILREELEEAIGPGGLMFFPSHPYPAPKHNMPLLRPFNWVYTAVLNVMTFPVTQVPLGLNHHHLPLGMQVASVPGNDHLTVAAALELERAFGGWVPPDEVA